MKKIITLSVVLSSVLANAFQVERYNEGESKGKVSRLQFDANRSIEYAYGSDDQVKRTYVGFKNVPQCSKLSVTPNIGDEEYCRQRGVLDEFYLDIKSAPTFLGFVEDKISDENTRLDFLVELLMLIRYRNKYRAVTMLKRDTPNLDIRPLVRIKQEILDTLDSEGRGYPKNWLILELAREMNELYLLQRDKAIDGSSRTTHVVSQYDKLRTIAAERIAEISRYAPDMMRTLSKMLENDSLLIYSTLTPEEIDYWVANVQPRLSISFDQTTRRIVPIYDDTAPTPQQKKQLGNNFEYLSSKITRNMTNIDGARDTSVIKILEHPLFRDRILFTDFALFIDFPNDTSLVEYDLNTSLMPSHKKYSNYYRDAVDLVNLYPKGYPFFAAGLIHEYGHLLQLFIDPAIKISHANVLDAEGGKYFVLSQIALQAVYFMNLGYLPQLQPFAEELMQKIVTSSMLVAESSAQFYMLDQTVQYLAK